VDPDIHGNSVTERDLRELALQMQQSLPYLCWERRPLPKKAHRSASKVLMCDHDKVKFWHVQALTGLEKISNEFFRKMGSQRLIRSMAVTPSAATIQWAQIWLLYER
jgi:hypothetical protein